MLSELISLWGQLKKFVPCYLLVFQRTCSEVKDALIINSCTGI